MKLAVISGASSGVGRAAARKFLAEGFQVVLVARSADKLSALAQELGDNAIPMACDASDGAAVLQMAQSVIERFGAPDVLINSAGAGHWKRIEDTHPDEAVQMMSAPYFAAFNMCHAFVPSMVARGRGVILQVNTPASIAAWPSSVGYTATRWALRGLHEALSQDLAGTGVRSCNVVFGHVDSAYFQHNEGVEEKLPALDRIIPLLSTETCARVLYRLSQKPRHQLIYPFTLWALLLLNPILPGLTRWLLRF